MGVFSELFEIADYAITASVKQAAKEKIVSILETKTNKGVQTQDSKAQVASSWGLSFLEL